MTDLPKIVERIWNEILDLRSIHRLLTSRLFKAAWDAATEDERKNVSYHIDMSAIQFIKAWIRKHNQNTLTIRELKEIAYQLGIYRYSRLSKNELLKEILEHDNDRAIRETGTISNRDSSQSGPDTPDFGTSLQI